MLTVLASEQVKDGGCERCRTPVRNVVTVVLPHHRVRRAAARGPGPSAELVGQGQDDATQLDRTLRGCDVRFRLEVRTSRSRSSPPASAIYGATFGDRAGASARRAARHRPRRRLWRFPRPAAQPDALAAGSGRRRRRALHRAYAVNPFNSERLPILGRQLRADGVRHGRHHGGAGARRARLCLRHPVRDPVRSSSPVPGWVPTRCWPRRTGPGTVVNSGRSTGWPPSQQDRDGDLCRAARFW